MTLDRKVITQVDQVRAITYVYGGCQCIKIGCHCTRTPLHSPPRPLICSPSLCYQHKRNGILRTKSLKLKTPDAGLAVRSTGARKRGNFVALFSVQRAMKAIYPKALAVVLFTIQRR